jgi:hypothetical protein
LLKPFQVLNKTSKYGEAQAEMAVNKVIKAGRKAGLLEIYFVVDPARLRQEGNEEDRKQLDVLEAFGKYVNMGDPKGDVAGLIVMEAADGNSIRSALTCSHCI